MTALAQQLGLAHQLGLDSVVATVPRLALTQAEAAKALGVSVDFLQEHVWGELRIVRRGRKGLVAVAELERWLERNAARTLEGRL